MSGTALGTLYVELNARATAFVREMDAAAERVEKFARQAKKLAGDVAHVAGIFTLAAGAALKLAADVDGRANVALTGLKDATRGLANQVAQMLLPAVNELAAGIRRVTAVIMSLSPETREQIATWVKWGGAILVAAKGLQLLSSVAVIASGALGALATGVAAIGLGPLLAIVAVLAAVAAAVAALHAIWRTNFLGIRDMVSKVAEYIADTFGGAFEFIGKAWALWVDAFALGIRGLIILAGTLAEALGNEKLANAAATALVTVNNIAKDLKSGAIVGKFVAAGLELAKASGRAFVDEWKRILNELGVMEWARALHAKIRGLISGPGALGFTVAGVGAMHDPIAEAGRRALRTRTMSDVQASMHGRLRDRIAEEPLSEGGVRAQNALNAIGDGFEVAGRTLQAKLGDFGQILDSAIKGAQMGGVWGAVAAVLVEFLSRTQGFARLLESLSGLINRIVGGFEPLMNAIGPPLEKLITVIGNIVESVLPILVPIFDVLGVLLDALTPPLQLIAVAVKALAPVLIIVAMLLTVVFTALKPIIQVIFEVAKPVLQFVLGIMRAIATIWNAIVNTLADVVDGIIAVITLGFVQHGGAFIRQFAIATGTMDDAMASLNSMTWESANATAANTTETNRNTVATAAATEATRSFTEALTNAPAGFKAAAYRFAADNGGGPFMGGGGRGGSTRDRFAIKASIMRDRARANTAATGNPSGGDTGAGGENDLARGGWHNPENRGGGDEGP